MRKDEDKQVSQIFETREIEKKKRAKTSKRELKKYAWRHRKVEQNRRLWKLPENSNLI